MAYSKYIAEIKDKNDVVYGLIDSDGRELSKDKASAIHSSKSGDIATFSDGSDSIPVSDCLVQINPVQSGTGDPSPTNVRTITGWTGANVYRTGANILDPADIGIGTKSLYNLSVGEQITTTGTGATVTGTNPFVITNTTGWRGAVFITKPLKANNKYMLNYRIEGSSNANIKRSLYWIDENDYIIRVVSNDASIAQNVDYVYTSYVGSNENPIPRDGIRAAWVFESKTTQTFNIYDLRLVVGNNRLDYAPYTAQTYPISWQTEAGTVYRGTLDVTTGELTVTAICEDMGDFDWTYNDTGTYPYFQSDSLPSPARIRAAGVKSVVACERYKAINNMTATNFKATDYNNQICFNSGISTGYKLIVQDSAYSDADLFKTAVTGTKIVTSINPSPGSYLVYQLTPVEILTLLGVNNVWSDTGATSVSYTADTKLYIENLTKPTEDDMTANANIASGVYFMVGNRLFLSTASIAQGEAIVPGTNCTETSLAEALNTINA